MSRMRYYCYASGVRSRRAGVALDRYIVRSHVSVLRRSDGAARWKIDSDIYYTIILRLVSGRTKKKNSDYDDSNNNNTTLATVGPLKIGV